MNAILDHYPSKLIRILFILMAGIFSTSCSIYDDEEDCPTGFYLRFKYDYNMKFADAFTNEVDRVTVFVFDQEGTYLMQQTEQGTALKDKNYRMVLDIAPGTYQLITWAGLDGSSFEIVDELIQGTTPLTEPRVRLLTQDNTSGSDLHPLWQGEAMELVVPETMYEETTISLVKDTKRIRMVLQQINGLPITDDDFEFVITDDNSLFDFRNHVISNGPISYTPYVSGFSMIGEVDPVTAVYFEASTSRLMENSQARLTITRVSDQQVIVNIPLIDYLLLTELEGHKDSMTAQEYLDRQDEYALVFFLDNNLSWLQVQIIVNGWTVRFNNGEL